MASPTEQFTARLVQARGEKMDALNQASAAKIAALRGDSGVPVSDSAPLSEYVGDTSVQLAEGVNTILGAIPNLVAPQSGAAQFFNNNADYWRGQQTDVVKAKTQVANAAIDRAGQNGVMSQIGEAIDQYSAEPDLAARFVTTNVPSMIPGVAAAKLAQAAALARGAQAARAAAIATTAAGGVNAVMNAGGARGDAYEDIKRTLILQGIPEAQAEEQALTDSLIPAAVGGMAGFVSGKTGLEKVITGTGGVGSKVAKSALGALAETLGEQAEEVFPKLATNAVAGQYDDRDLGKDVGRTIVETAIGSGPTTGASAAIPLFKELAKSNSPTQTTDPVVFGEAAASNDPTPFLDPSVESYNPATAIGVMFAHNQLDTTSPEVKQANLDQADKILSDLENQYDTLVEQRKTATGEEATQINTQLKQLQRHIKGGNALIDSMINQVEPVPTTEQVKVQVEQANQPSTPEGIQAAESIINLSMRNVDSISREDADALIANESNSLSPSQRDYLRAFSAARVSENQLSTMSKVSQEVLYGSDKNVGISQYRQRVGTAIASGNEQQANRQLGMLTSFAEDHASKAATAAKAIAQGLGTQILRKENGDWFIPTTPVSEKERIANGGLNLNSGRLVRDIQTEAKALQNAQAEMAQAISLRFGKKGVESKSSAKTTPPSQNISTLEDVEDKARPESKLSETSKTEPPSPPKKDKQAQADARIAAQEKALADAVAATEARKQAKEAITESVDASPSPQSLPASAVVADAPSATATPVAQETKGEEKEAQPVVVAQPAEAAAQAPVVQATTAEENTEVEEEKGLSLFKQQTPKGEARPYQARNLIADYFAQKAGKDTGSVRPLVEVPGFLSKLKANFDIARDYLKEKTLTDQQAESLTTFASLASTWMQGISDNFSKGTNPDFYYKDLTNFFLNEEGKADENVQAAIAYGAYSFVVENASRSQYNTNEEINAILNKDEDAIISIEAESLLRNVGTREAVIVNAIGQKVVQALGLSSLASAPANLQSQLIADLGAHAMKILLDEGIMVRTQIPGEQFATLTNGNTNVNAKQKFISMARDDKGELTTVVQQIKEASKGSQGVLDKLFGAEAGLKEPGFTKIPFTQQNPRNTSQKVPSNEAKIMTHENAQPNYVRMDMWQLMGQLHPEVALAIAGVESINEAVTHVVNQASINAKNDGLRREYDRMMEYFNVLQAQDKIEDPMFFEHTVWKQQRVGIATNMINPQTSKLHRRMLARPSWTVEVLISDTATMENFKLRVAEGLGVKTDKQSNEKSLMDLQEAIAQPEIKGAVAVLRKSITEGGITAEEQQKLLAGVQAGGEAMHTLDSLMAMAHYLEAVKNGKDTFTTQIMGEVDGVTNGPMLSHLLMGAAPSVEQLYSLLNRGGFYEEGNDHTQYNLWRSEAGHLDLYEITSLHMVQAIEKMEIPQAQAAALYSFTGTLAKDDKVTKDGRNIIKTPLTAMVFGSSIKGSIDSMADKFIESVYGKMEDAAAGKVELKDLVRNLTTLGVKLNPNITIKDLMTTPLTTSQIGTLKGVFTETIGKAVESTMKEDFSTFVEQRRTFNITAQMSFDLYNAAYQGLRDARIAELVKSGDISVNKTTGEPLHDLTTAQEAQLRKEVESILPLMHTAFSQETGELNAGLMASKTARKLSTKSTYTSEVKFGKPFPDGPKSLKIAGYEQSETAPGVAMSPMSVHATDSYISHTAAMLSEVLNVHDAHGAGLANFMQAAQNLNQATWEAMLKYSPASQMADTFTRVLQGVATMYEQGNLPEQSQQALQKIIGQYAAQMKTPAGSVLDMQAKAIKDLAYAADSMKLQAMERMGAVDQYALQGGNYEVTDADRKAAKKARISLDSTLSAEQQQALASLSALASGVKKVAAQPDVDTDVAIDEMQSIEEVSDVVPLPGPYTSPWGELGAPAIVSNQYLVDAFNQDPVMTGKLAVQTLRKAIAQQADGRSKSFNDNLLNLIEKTIPKDVVVQMITPATPASQVLAEGSEKSRGWFVAKGNDKQVNLLSPDFKYSGLTPEVMLHELTHASLATTVQAELDAKAKDTTYTSETLDLVNDLESLRALASDYVKKNKLQGFGPALENVHEFISWGMSNLDFQRTVLNKVSMKSDTTGNRFVTGMKRFIETLTGLLFKGSNKSAQEQQENGVAVLIANVSGLFYAAAQSKSKADLVLNQENTAENTPALFSTMQIFDSLNGAVSAGFSVQLKGLLQGIVDVLHGPFGTFKEQMMQNSPTSPVEAYAQALQSGKAPFASQSLAAGFRISDQEAFVLEQVEATVRAALEDNVGHTTASYQELAKLYQEASAKLKVEDFHDGVWANATVTEKAEAKALHDFVFALDQNADKKSDYLARFAALGLAHERVANLLNFATDVKTDRQLAGLTFAEKLHAVYDMVLSWLNGQFTGTFEGQQADEKLEQLVTTLVNIEAKKRLKKDQQRNQTMQLIEDTFRDVSETARDKLEQFGRSPFFKDSANSFLKLGGNVVSTVAGDRVGLVMEGIIEIRDRHFRQRQGLVAGVINEIRGSNKDNLSFFKMLRISKHIEGTRKDIITNTAKFTLESFENGGEYLTKEMKAAIAQTVLRTDAASLTNTYSVADTMKLMQDKAFRDREIARLARQLTGVPNFGHYFVKSAKLLGYYKATGRVAGANLMFNAENIARLYGTQFVGRINDATVAKVTPNIDTLVSLYALSYLDSKHAPYMKEVLDTESARTDGNGIEMILKLHAQLQKDSKDRLFAAGETLYMKGYVPEIFNPYIELVAANEDDGQTKLNEGFTKGPAVSADAVDPDQDQKHLYVLRDGGMQSHLTGIISYTGTKAKGSPSITGGTSLLSSQGLTNLKTMADIDKGKAPLVRDMFRADPGFDPTKVGGSQLAPVLNAVGDVVNYRYMMAESTKDNLLERDNRFEHLLGALAGNIFDKEMTKEQNGKAIQALKDQYDLEFAQKSHSYVRVGPQSTDPEMREIWRLLPESTKQNIRDIWGNNNMMVRVDLLDINFGYRKLSIADTFTKDAEQRNAVERILFEIGNFFFGEKARLRFKQGEDIWQAFVREAKDTLVVKSGITLLGNVSSNLTELMWFGVPIPDILRHHRVAMKGALAYRQDNEKLERINLQLSTGYLPASNMADLQRQKVILEDSLARNPVRELIDAGLMPTIVEDVAADDDMYSFKGRFTRKVDEFVDSLNPHVVNTAKTLLITHDTPLYKVLSYGTQLSDFVARYTLYMHMTERQRNPMGKEEAVQLVSDAFINYDVPSHRLLQYANDTGIIFFSKYYLRIQKVIAHLYKENPGRALMLLTASHFFDAVPTLMDSSVVNRVGNPFSTGALKYVTSLDEIGTINALMTPLK